MLFAVFYYVVAFYLIGSLVLSDPGAYRPSESGWRWAMFSWAATIVLSFAWPIAMPVGFILARVLVPWIFDD